MTETTAPEPGATQLDPVRLEEIRGLVPRLLRPAPEDVPQLLADARAALADLLADRADLVRANAKAGEELAAWTGGI
ncbi:hypothetical protein [Streptomyces collinus]